VGLIAAVRAGPFCLQTGILRPSCLSFPLLSDGRVQLGSRFPICSSSFHSRLFALPLCCEILTHLAVNLSCPAFRETDSTAGRWRTFALHSFCSEILPRPHHFRFRWTFARFSASDVCPDVLLDSPEEAASFYFAFQPFCLLLLSVILSSSSVELIPPFPDFDVFAFFPSFPPPQHRLPLKTGARLGSLSVSNNCRPYGLVLSPSPAGIIFSEMAVFYPFANFGPDDGLLLTSGALSLLPFSIYLDF